MDYKGKIEKFRLKFQNAETVTVKVRFLKHNDHGQGLNQTCLM